MRLLQRSDLRCKIVSTEIVEFVDLYDGYAVPSTRSEGNLLLRRLARRGPNRANVSTFVMFDEDVHIDLHSVKLSDYVRPNDKDAVVRKLRGAIVVDLEREITVRFKRQVTYFQRTKPRPRDADRPSKNRYAHSPRPASGYPSLRLACRKIKSSRLELAEDI